jgi:hypothetical protein
MRIGILVGVVDWLIGLPLAYAIGVLLDTPLGGLLHWSSNEPGKPAGILTGGLIGVFLCWLMGALTFGLLNGYASKELEKRLLVVPNQGIRRSARIGLFAGLLGGFFWMLLFAPGWTTPYEWGIEWLFLSLFTGLVFAPFVGLFIGLCFGGAAWVKHICLRLFLWRAGCLPWRYVQFLDYAAERILLRKVGGGYIFVHRLLLDYFASLETLPDPPL